MCSLDVSSLFTNVPLEETLNICLDKLYSLADPPALPRVVLRKLLEFATKKSHFLFDGKYYDQIDDVAMGSPLGPVLGPSRTRGQNCLFMSKSCHHNEKPSATSLFTRGQNLVAAGQTSKMPSTTSGAGQIETNLGKQKRGYFDSEMI